VNPDDLRSAYRYSFGVVCVVALAGGIFSIVWARNFLFFGLWSTLNLRAWHGLLQSTILKRNLVQAHFWVLLKIPILLGLGVFYVAIFRIEPISFLLGFNVVFAVILIHMVLAARGNKVVTNRKVK
jgi:protein-S-isoprenylcysteine O-methyltransferase Ste14